jgi:hypothetical protein
MVAPTTPSDARVKKRLREFFNGPPDSPIILMGCVRLVSIAPPDREPIARL